MGQRFKTDTLRFGPLRRYARLIVERVSLGDVFIILAGAPGPNVPPWLLVSPLAFGLYWTLPRREPTAFAEAVVAVDGLFAVMFAGPWLPMAANAVRWRIYVSIKQRLRMGAVEFKSRRPD